MHDTCGVHNLHGLPGVLAAIIGAICASQVENNFENDAEVKSTFSNIADGKTPSEQAWMQLSALLTTLGISILGGLLTGFIASRFGKLEAFFDDT